MAQDAEPKLMTSHNPEFAAGRAENGHPDHAGAPLPPPVQEHLAQQLRATYQVMAAKPAYLGDPVLPPEFDRHLTELDLRERTALREKAHNLGVEAVEAALEPVASGAIAPLELAADTRRKAV
jgi:hypothetical protein